MSRTQPPRTMLRARIKCRKSNDSTDARMTFKGSYTLPLHLQRQSKNIHGSHLAPVHGNRYVLKETSDDLAQKFRSKKQTWRKASLKLGLISPPVEFTTYSCRSATTEYGPECVKTPATFLPSTSDGAEYQAIKIDLGVIPQIALVEIDLGHP